VNQSRGAVRGFLLSPPSGFIGSDAGGSDPWKRPKCSGFSAGSRPKRSHAETLSRAKAGRHTALLEQRAELNPAWLVPPTWLGAPDSMPPSAQDRSLQMLMATMRTRRDRSPSRSGLVSCDRLANRPEAHAPTSTACVMSGLDDLPKDVPSELTGPSTNAPSFPA
jgi:hypothetical protein